jgi:hypothetical protein
MKLVLKNPMNGKSVTVLPRGELTKCFHEQVYLISKRTFNRIVHTLAPHDNTFEDARDDKIKYRLIRYAYNFRGHGDQKDYYIAVKS